MVFSATLTVLIPANLEVFLSATDDLLVLVPNGRRKQRIGNVLPRKFDISARNSIANRPRT